MSNSLPPWVPNPSDLSDGDIIQWDEALGRFVPATLPSLYIGEAFSVRLNSTEAIPLSTVFEILASADFRVDFANTNWSVNQLTGQCTRISNNPVTTAWMIVCTASLSAGGGFSSLAISKNGSLVGAGPSRQASVSTVTDNGALNNRIVPTSILITNIVNGDVIAPIFATDDGSSTILNCNLAMYRIA